jgi:hypothetical protein
MPLEGDRPLLCLSFDFSAYVGSTECGNMLIMALSYTQKSNDSSLISQYVRAHEHLFPHVCSLLFTDEPSQPMDRIPCLGSPHSRESD